MIAYRYCPPPPARPKAAEVRAVAAETARTVARIVAEPAKPKPAPKPPRPSRPASPRIEVVIRAACEVMGISRDDILGRERKRQVAWRRQVVMLVCYDIADHASLPQIGRAFGRDHTTILHGVNASAERLLRYPELRALYDAIVAKAAERQAKDWAA